MATYLITYDLNAPGQDYDKLYEAIKKLGACWHCLDSNWFVISSKTASAIRDYLKPYIDSNDSLLVLKSSGVGAWTGFDDKCSSWLNDNL